jgi:CubicO group peptidase (beta-lactamase class C family)
MTKPVVSAALMMLWEQGLLSLRDPVAKFVPAFGDARVYRLGAGAAPIGAPASEAMLVQHVLAHTSGLSYPITNTAIDDAYRNAGFGRGSEDYTLQEACERWASVPLLFEPGTGWAYGYSTDVVARIVEVVSGARIDDFVRERILEPLGMRETAYVVDAADLGRVVPLHSYDHAAGRAVPAEGFAAPSERPMFVGGSAGLLGTAADYHRFAQMLARGGELDGVRLLAPRTIELMAANHLPGGAAIADISLPTFISRGYPGRGFGLGFAPVVDPAATGTLTSRGEYTWGGAAGTDFFVDPAQELTVVFMTQVLGSAGRRDVRTELRRLVNQAIVA